MTADVYHERSQLTSQLNSLRAHLKEWEKTFSATHAGKKPSREDIKNDTSGIGEKYKDYNRTRDIVEGRVKDPGSPKRAKSQHLIEKKTSAAEGDNASAVKPPSPCVGSTPRKSLHPSNLDPYDAPSSATPRRPFRTTIGPTPQRDGKVLGLFDLLSTSGASRATPRSKRKRDTVLGEGTGNVIQTPSRKRIPGDLLSHLDDDDGPNTGKRQRFSKTPVSEGKKFLLSQFFATPSTVRFTAEQEGDAGLDKTPLRTKLLAGRDDARMMQVPEPENGPFPHDTPAFLRRTSSLNQWPQGPVSQISFASPERTRTGPSGLRLFKKGRGLSEIVRDLRQAQDEAHDDDLDALREMEDGGEDAHGEQDIQVESSQLVDGGEPAEQQRTWKKKGQKRTTKRTKMRPPKAIFKEKPEENEVTEDSADELIAIGEAQPRSTSRLNDSDLDSDPDFNAKPTDKLSRKKVGEAKDQIKGKGRKVKVSAVSHMNFRSLKIKNKNSKANGRGSGRFGGRGRR